MKRVLVIDDEQTTIELLKHGLKVRGFDVITATDGIEGFVLAQEANPDLIICDVMMPNLDGCSFVRQCSTTEELCDVPVFILTSHENLEGKFDGLDIAGYFVKPVNLKSILENVEAKIGES
ncbi:MAG: DNA-binding response OmpR family regulator [Lysobacterales bacterium]|jgi:DNA-binding response OmpR family regulator